MDLISVVIPAFNAQAYLGDAVRSVLSQGWPHLEVIVVDNASTDDTARIARAFGPPVQCHRSEPSGQAPTTNFGIRQATGAWLAFIDADDLWAPGKLARQMSAFATQPDLDAVFAHAANFSGTAPDPDAGAVPGVPAPLHGAMLIRRDTFLRVGYFDERYRIGAILDWYMRAQEAGLRMTTLPETLLYRRIHDDNLSTREKRNQGDFALILKAALERRRKASRGA